MKKSLKRSKDKKRINRHIRNLFKLSQKEKKEFIFPVKSGNISWKRIKLNAKKVKMPRCSLKKILWRGQKRSSSGRRSKRKVIKLNYSQEAKQFDSQNPYY